MRMDVEELMGWLSRFGELVTMSVRIFRECSGLCGDLSIRYLMILLGLDLINFCRYFGYEVESCYDDVLKMCGNSIMKGFHETVDVGKRLSAGEYIGNDFLKHIINELPMIYLCLSRMIASNISKSKTLSHLIK